MSANGDFDLSGPLPTAGITMLEASAGTGKTYTIAALAVRYVADGVPLERMLLVTFTRMATGELRARVRRRLAETHRGLAAVLAGRAPDAADEVVRLLATGTDAEIHERHRLLGVALAGFDAATITTTHGFCHQMLAGLGVAGDVETTTSVVEDVDDLVEEVVADRYLARALQTTTPPFGRAEALEVSLAAVRNPRTPIANVPGDPDAPGRLRRRLALSVKADVARRKRDAGLLTYDDLLTRLSDALDDPVSGPAARRRLRDRYDVVAVDEFQDTDEVQWRILRTAFGDGPVLVLIGDPKQAIYGFRGADVYAYLDAAAQAAQAGTLGVNWRSDQALLDAYDVVWDGASLGPDDIVYRRVRAAPTHRRAGLVTPLDPAPLQVRIVDRTAAGITRTDRTAAPSAPSARQVIGRDLAGQIVALLEGPSWRVTHDADGRETKRERLVPGDIAVLTRSHRNAAVWSAALTAAGVPSVINGVGSVFATPAARDWLLLLEAIERPASSARVHNVALTSFVGWSVAEIDAADDASWEALHAACHHWAGVLRRSGVATLLELVSRTRGLPGRELSKANGERHVTDIRHLGQLLHAEASAERLGATALTAWLRHRIRDADDDTGVEERSRRLESDADAVQVLTIHRSKGLEFPVVAYPDLWEHRRPGDAEPVVYHDDDGRRMLDVAGRGADYVAHRQRQRDELRGEDLRLAYVALTRSRHRSLVWWVGTYDAGDSPLGRLVFGRGQDGTVAVDGVPTPSDEEALDRFEGLAKDAPDRIRVERVSDPQSRRWSPATVGAGELRVASWDRSIDERWRRTSYTGLTADAHEPVVASEPEQGALGDEGAGADTPEPLPATDPGVGDDEAVLRAVHLPLAEMPGGARVGTLVHSVLEDVDFIADDLTGAITTALAAHSSGTVPIGPGGVVVDGLLAALRTPLGPLVDGRRLCDLARVDRLDELAFELPVAGGDRPVGDVGLADVADLVERHLPAGDPLEGYPDRLRDPAISGTWRGYLTGSLDLVARLGAPGGEPRWVVMDYKTNVLGDDRSRLSAWDYRPEALATAMQAAHYPLQALLYLVALHRYLRWRHAGYDGERHLGGALYLFVRGMSGPDGPDIAGGPCGVFAWKPPFGLVADLSDLLDRGGARPDGDATA